MRTLALFLLAGSAIAAPVPKEIAHPPAPGITHGHYTLTWGSTPYAAALSPGGDFAESAGGVDWYGWWEWDSATRTLSVCETPDHGRFWIRWKVILDNRLSGTNCGGTPIRLTRTK